jgi:hypothetical protein
MFNSAAVEVTPSKMFSSAVVAVTPSNKFISVAVEVTATFSFIFGDVKVLFVSVSVVALPIIVSVAAGKVKVTLPEYAE